MDPIIQATIKTRDYKNHIRIFNTSQIDLDSIKLKDSVVISKKEKVLKVAPDEIIKPKESEKSDTKKFKKLKKGSQKK